MIVPERKDGLHSPAAARIREYERSQAAAGALCDTYVQVLRSFDRSCAELFPDEGDITQGMVDAWCEVRPTEGPNSCLSRCSPVVSLVRFLNSRGEAELVVPELPRQVDTGYMPHHFTDEELVAFFRECDSWQPDRTGADRGATLRTKRTIPVLFRLLYSSGIRTVEARKLRRRRVDLEGGTLLIAEGKGRAERLVALHPSMLAIMRDYDESMEGLCPGREYFFPNGRDGHLSKHWLQCHFRELWDRVSPEHATAYQLRHEYAVRNIDGLVAGGLEGLEELEYLSKSMGHASVERTIRTYYHITPGLARALQERCGDLDDVVPEVRR